MAAVGTSPGRRLRSRGCAWLRTAVALFALARGAVALAAQEPERPPAGAFDLAAFASQRVPEHAAPLRSLLPAFAQRLFDREAHGVDDAVGVLTFARQQVYGVTALPPHQVVVVVGMFLTLDDAAARGESLPAAVLLELASGYGVCTRLAPLLGMPLVRAELAPMLGGICSSRSQLDALLDAVVAALPSALQNLERIENLLVRAEVTEDQRLRVLELLAASPRLEPGRRLACAEERARSRSDGAAWILVADSSLRAGDVPRARTALAQARAWLERRPVAAPREVALLLEDARVLERTRRLDAKLGRIAALEAIANAGAASAAGAAMEAEIARAQIQEACGDEDEAQRSLERLQHERPRDARPLVQLARRAFAGGRPDEARDWLAKADRLSPHDATYWLLRMVLDAEQRSIGEDLDPAEFEASAAKLRAELARTHHERVDLLRLVIRCGMTAPSLAKEDAGARYLARWGKVFPEAQNAYQQHGTAGTASVAFVSAMFAEQRSRALRALRMPLPKEHVPGLALIRAQNWLAVATNDGDPVSPEEFAPLLEDLRQDQRLPWDAALLLGTQLAILARRGDGQGSWERAARTIGAAVPPRGYPSRSQALNNLGVALLQLGRREQALAAFEEAMANGDPEFVATTNSLLGRASDDAEEPLAQARTKLQQLLQAQRVAPDVGAQIAGWLAAFAQRAGDEALAQRWCRAAVDALDHRPPVRPRAPGFDDGVRAIGGLQSGYGLGFDGAIEVTVKSQLELWLLPEPPLREKELRRRAKAR